jgi:hypothetical protein
MNGMRRQYSQFSSHDQRRLVRVDPPALVEQVGSSLGAVEEDEADAEDVQVHDVAWVGGVPRSVAWVVGWFEGKLRRHAWKELEENGEEVSIVR